MTRANQTLLSETTLGTTRTQIATARATAEIEIARRQYASQEWELQGVAARYSLSVAKRNHRSRSIAASAEAR